MLENLFSFRVIIGIYDLELSKLSVIADDEISRRRCIH